MHIEAESIGWIPLDEGRNLFSFQYGGKVPNCPPTEPRPVYV